MGQVATHSAVADEEYVHSKQLCTDRAYAELCEFVACGYTPDYQGIEDRTRADAEAAVKMLANDACRLSKRYNTRRGYHDSLQIQTAIMATAISAATRERESERREVFKLNHDMRFQHAKALEDVRIGRLNHAAKERENASQMLTERWASHSRLSVGLDREVAEHLRERWTAWTRHYEFAESGANQLSEQQWKMFAESAFRSLREGGEMLASAAQAYQFLAASIRTSAKQGGAGAGGVASVLSALAIIVPMFSGSCEAINIPLLGKFEPNRKDCCAPAPAP
jgi:hypothetical protein